MEWKGQSHGETETLILERVWDLEGTAADITAACSQYHMDDER